MDWSKLPDIVAIGLLATAFASVARRSNSRASGIWLTGWLLIALHFAAFIFLPAPRAWGLIAALVGLASLSWAGVLFMWAGVPYRSESSSRWMLLVLLCANTIYLCCLVYDAPGWVLTVAAVLLGVGPLAVAIKAIPGFSHPLRWITVTLYASLAVYLLLVQRRGGNGPELALNGLLFTIYFGCCLHFWYSYRRATAGAFITVSGFFLWACAFVAGPLTQTYLPLLHVESEVWNLPKFVVGIGMILLLLEDQIEQTTHLALHDPLTGLPNRLLFRDRLASSLERARRTGAQTALLVLDLDRFKQVNDSMGHHIGDLLLKHVANLISGRMRRSDTVARTGGDEFTVILEGPTNASEALHVGRSLQDRLKEPVVLEDHSVQIGGSFGIAVFPDDATDIEQLCIVADLRMYDNKRAGYEVSDGPHHTPRTPLSPRKMRSSDANRS